MILTFTIDFLCIFSEECLITLHNLSDLLSVDTVQVKLGCKSEEKSKYFIY